MDSQKIITVLAILASAYVIAGLAQPNLRYFNREEFGLFWPLIDDDLLEKLDELRHQWGKPIFISPVEGGVGRVHEDSQSQHNIINTYGVVRAVDIFPAGASGESMTTAEAEQFVEFARNIGFTGIGVYTDTYYDNRPWIMVHVDVRLDREVGNPALWSRIEQEYQNIRSAFL